MKSLGSPTFEKLKSLNRTNWINDNPVVETDIKTAEDIGGKDTAALKGCTARKTVETFADNTVETLQVKLPCGDITPHMDAGNHF